MQNAEGFHLVLVTAPNIETARTLTEAILQARLAACVNLLPQVESHYWWQSKLDQSAEVLMVIKTMSSHLVPLEDLIRTRHPYDTPEYLVLNVAAGNERYLQWWRTSVSV